jgi:hypothetical protein
MPKQVEEKLRKEAERKFPDNKEKQNAYIYGRLRKQGWKPRRERK